MRDAVVFGGHDGSDRELSEDTEDDEEAEVVDSDEDDVTDDVDVACFFASSSSSPRVFRGFLQPRHSQFSHSSLFT